MSTPKVVFKQCYFKSVAQGASSAALPVSFTGYELGTVLTVSGSRENEEAVFEEPVGGRWVDTQAVNQRDRVILTVTCGDISQRFIELIEAMGAGTGYTVTETIINTGVRGNAMTLLGWFRVDTTDDGGVFVCATQSWAKLDVTSWEVPQVGYCQATFTVRLLYNALNSASFVTGL